MTTNKSKSLSISLVIHSAVILLLLGLNSTGLLTPTIDKPVVRAVTRIFAPTPAAPSRGGAGPDEAPARKGTPPPHVYRAFIAPERKADPKLPMPVGVEVDAPVTTLVAADMGDPLSKFTGTSLGVGKQGGIGDYGCCGGVGPGHDRGPNFGGGSGHPITAPQLIYKVEPEFSEEARKAKFQGTVILSIEVDTEGKPSRLKVVSSPGLGLDQKALDAVAQWRFRPAFRDGRPFASSARIEVNFHLM